MSSRTKKKQSFQNSTTDDVPLLLLRPSRFAFLENPKLFFLILRIRLHRAARKKMCLDCGLNLHQCKCRLTENEKRKDELIDALSGKSHDTNSGILRWNLFRHGPNLEPKEEIL